METFNALITYACSAAFGARCWGEVVSACMNVGIKTFSGGGLSGKLGLLNVVIYGKLDIGGTLVEVEFSEDYAIRTQAHLCCSLANLNGVRKIKGEVAGVRLMVSY